MKKYLVTFLLGAIAGAAGFWHFQHRVDLDAWKETGSHMAEITPEQIRKELAATSVVIREKAQAASGMLWNVTTNARTTATIKAKLFAESGLTSMRIHVDSAGSLVTLSGTADTHDQVARAVQMALDTEGVSKVVSTIQVQQGVTTTEPNPPAQAPPAASTNLHREEP